MNNNKQIPCGTWSIEIRFCFCFLVAIISGSLIMAALHTSMEMKTPLLDYKKINNNNSSTSSCNLYSGKWVYDDSSGPLYNGLDCSFMDDGMACEKYGRTNLGFLYWRWQPHDCHLPRFDAMAMLEKLRNKRLVFVGDSLNRNQWVSMVCLLESKIAPALKYVHFNGSLVTFKATGSFESEDGVYEDVEMLRGYEMALKTWSDWVDTHVNNTRTKLFFVSMSPTHDRAEEWGKPKGGNCFNETEPILNEGHWGMDSDPRMMGLVEAAITKLSARGFKVHMLNITQLSEYRKEAHSSIYRKHWDPLTKEQLLNPSSYADCMHWCLPGVPDFWNILLYAHLFYPLQS